MGAHMKSNEVGEIVVTEEDIKYAEKVLFGKVDVFDNEDRVPIIQNFNESIDVNACPGSGKTTVLLAKLIILSRKLPLKNGQGICVITHTNVAIDEIKEKLGDKSDILFKYPNYFGTIQNFIDTFLAIPFFKYKYNSFIRSIDDDIYYDTIRKLAKYKYPSILSEIELYIKKGYGNYTNDSFENNLIRFVVNKHLLLQNKELKIMSNGQPLSRRRFYNDLERIMIKNTFNKGIFRFEDSYLMSEMYINEFPKLKDFISSRFKYVFIDEIQDVSNRQIEIFDMIFNKEKVIIQKFGDVNQSIGRFDGPSVNYVTSEFKTINSSNRYGEAMIKFLEPLRVFKQGRMRGNTEIETIVPHLIIYDEKSINLVVEKFYELLTKYNIKEEKNKKIKIIGKIGMKVSEDSKSISSYVDGYHSNSSKEEPFSKKVRKKLFKCGNVEEFYNYIISLIIMIIKVNDEKVSKDKFVYFMEVKYKEKLNVFRASIVILYHNLKKDTEVVLKKIMESINELLSNIDEVSYDQSVLESKLSEEYTIEEEKDEAAVEVENGRYQITSKDNVDTVLGTKGETHIATLYLDSKLTYRHYKDLSDISRILDYMLNKKEEVCEADKDALMNAYVAMSRAERLTCIAIQYSTIKGKIQEFKEYGYKIIGCDENIEELIKKEINLTQ